MAPKTPPSGRKFVPRKNTVSKTKPSDASASSVPGASSPIPLAVQRDDALAWLKGVSLPSNWDKFATRDIVCERRFLWRDILTNSALHEVRFGKDDAVAIFDKLKHYRKYVEIKDSGFPSLTRLFYSSLTVSEDGNIIHGFIGTFKFSFTILDVVNIYDDDPFFAKIVTNVFSARFRELIPSPEILLETLFICPNKKPHALVKHLHLLYDMIIHSNILPSKGNKTEMTRRMIELVWIMEHHKPCLAHLIFHNRRDVLSNKKSVTLPYPCFVTSLLRYKGFVFSEFHESPLHLDIVDAKVWDRCVIAGSDTRMDAFDAKGLRYTEGLVVGGLVLEETHPSFVSRKRKAIASPESSSSTFSSEVIARLESSIASLTNAVTTMNLSFVGSFEGLNAKVDRLQSDVNGLKTDMAAVNPIVLSFGDQEKAVESDADDDDGGPLFFERDLLGESTPVGGDPSVTAPSVDVLEKDASVDPVHPTTAEDASTSVPTSS